MYISLNFQTCSDCVVFCIHWLHVLRTTMASTWTSLQVLRTWSALPILTLNVLRATTARTFSTFPLPKFLRSGKHMASQLFYLSRACVFLIWYSFFCFSLFWLFPPLLLCLSILSEGWFLNLLWIFAGMGLSHVQTTQTGVRAGAKRTDGLRVHGHPCDLCTFAQIGQWWMTLYKVAGSSSVVREVSGFVWVALCRSCVACSFYRVRYSVDPAQGKRGNSFVGNPSLAGWAVSQRSRGWKATKNVRMDMSVRLMEWNMFVLKKARPTEIKRGHWHAISWGKSGKSHKLRNVPLPWWIGGWYFQRFWRPMFRMTFGNPPQVCEETISSSGTSQTEAWLG